MEATFLYTHYSQFFLSSCSKSIVTDLCFTIYLKLDFIDIHTRHLSIARLMDETLSHLIYDFLRKREREKEKKNDDEEEATRT